MALNKQKEASRSHTRQLANRVKFKSIVNDSLLASADNFDEVMHKTMTSQSPRKKSIVSQSKTLQNSMKKLDLAKAQMTKGGAKIEDEEVFDRHMAVMQISSPSAETNLNPLFMNTKYFNMKTAEYKAAKLQ